MKDFYLTMQKKSLELNCYVLNGRYTPANKGIINEYTLIIVDDPLIHNPTKISNLESLIKFAKENFKFSEANYENGACTSWLTFYNLVV